MGTMAIQDKKANTLVAKYRKLNESANSILMNSKKGLRPQAVFDFIIVSRFSNQLVEQVLNKTLKTLTSYKNQNTSLDAVISEKLLKLFSLFDKGIVVFGSAEEFGKWLELPAFGLGNQVPVDLLDTITGIDLVKEELIRIEYGDVA